MEKTTSKYSVECLLYDCKPSDLKERTTCKINNMSELKNALDTHLKPILEEINDCCGLASHDWMVNEKISEKNARNEDTTEDEKIIIHEILCKFFNCLTRQINNGKTTARAQYCELKWHDVVVYVKTCES
jgi:hypothetical protein